MLLQVLVPGALGMEGKEQEKESGNRKGSVHPLQRQLAAREPGPSSLAYLLSAPLTAGLAMDLDNHFLCGNLAVCHPVRKRGPPCRTGPVPFPALKGGPRHREPLGGSLTGNCARSCA